MIKKLKVLLSVLALCLAFITPVFAADNTGAYSIELNSREIGAHANVIEGELFIPLRIISESLGYQVGWSPADKMVTLTKSTRNIVIDLKAYKITVDGHEAFLAAQPVIINGRTFVPAALLADNLALRINTDQNDRKLVLTSIAENRITIVNRKERTSSETLEQTIQYPEIQGLENSDAQDKINSVFKDLAMQAKAQGEKNERDLPQILIENHIRPETYFNYAVKYNQQGKLSVVFDDYQFAGGAHGGTIRSSCTFNLATGTSYKIRDVFKEGEDYKAIINAEIRKQMQEREMSATLVPFNSIKEDQDFYIDNNSLVIYFQQYEYYPYAMGIPEFAINRTDLSDRIKQDLFSKQSRKL